MSWPIRFLWWLNVLAIFADAVMIGSPFLPFRTRAILMVAAILKAGWCVLRLKRL